jgi:hypothetical protein
MLIELHFSQHSGASLTVRWLTKIAGKEAVAISEGAHTRVKDDQG